MSDRQIVEAIQKLAGTHLTDEVYIIPCTVDSIDRSTRSCTCTAIGGQAITEIPNVQLMADVDDGLLLIPTIGSTVFVTYSKRHSPFVSLFASIDEVLIITGDTSISVKDKLIQFNDGSYGGLIQINKLITKLNNLENLLNDLVLKYNVHIHAVAGSSTAPTVLQETSTLTATQKTELENPKIIHGQ